MTARGIGDNNGPELDDDVEDLGYPGRDGYIKLARSIRYHPVVGFGLNNQPFRPSEAFIDLLMECRYKSGRINNGGKVMTLLPGQLLGAVSWLADRWRWTPKQVRLFLDKLEAEHSIELGYGADQNRTVSGTADAQGTDEGKHRGKQARVITICNYALYQVLQEPEGQTTGHVGGQTKGNQGANKGQHIRKGRKEEGNPDSPHTPRRGDVFAEEFPKTDAKTKRREELQRQKETIDEAIRVFNLAAGHFGFTPCTTRDSARDVRLAKRIDAIGGLERFKDALRSLRGASGLNDFLLGRLPPRPGDSGPFKLSIDALLQTQGNLGNVLARLLDQAAATQHSGPRWAEWDRETWRKEIAAHANGVWPPDKIGHWPGHPKCAAPEDVLEEMGLKNAYDENGIKRGARHGQ